MARQEAETQPLGPGSLSENLGIYSNMVLKLSLIDFRVYKFFTSPLSDRSHGTLTW